MPMRSGMVSDRPGYHKNHILNIPVSSPRIGGEQRFLKIRNNCIPVTRKKVMVHKTFTRPTASCESLRRSPKRSCMSHMNSGNLF